MNEQRDVAAESPPSATDEAAAPSLRRSLFGWHTKRFLIAFYSIAIAFGVLDPSEESDLAFLLSLGASFSMAWWAITDASDRRRPLRLSVRALVILFGWIAAPLYLLWTRQLMGVCWIALNAIGFLTVGTLAYWLPRAALEASERF